MDDKILFTKILGLKPPWFIDKVAVKEKQQRIDIYVDHEPGIRVRCPVCTKFYGVYDHSPERVYRHLDTCQMSTFGQGRKRGCGNLPIAGCRPCYYRKVMLMDADMAKAIRLELQLNQNQMAEAMGTHRQTWVKWERGDRAPSGSAARLAQALLWMKRKGLLADFLKSMHVEKQEL